MKKAKNNYSRQQIINSRNNPRKVWKIMNKRLNKNRTKIIFNDQHHEVTNESEIANILNSNLSSVG